MASSSTSQRCECGGLRGLAFGLYRRQMSSAWPGTSGTGSTEQMPRLFCSPSSSSHKTRPPLAGSAALALRTVDIAAMELPSDIVSAIASMADEERDVKVVKACALVSRVWSLGARPYVFRRVAIRDEASLEEFLDLLCKTQDVQGYVQGLSFERKRTSAAEPSSTWVLGAPRRLSYKLPMVHEISFHKVLILPTAGPITSSSRVWQLSHR